MASKLFLLPLVPALAFGIVEVASRISMPSTPVAAPAVVVVEHSPPVKRIIVEPPPPPSLPPEPECRGCVTST